jgi:sec-independent protein translocase protein TatA
MLTPLAIWSGPDLLIILAIVVLVFGASKLPDLARGSGQALRIFKAEARGMKDDEERAKALESKDAQAEKLAALDAKQAELDAERAKITNPDS